MEQARIEGETIVTREGHELPVPETGETTQRLTAGGVGYVAYRPTPEQLSDYYEAGAGHWSTVYGMGNFSDDETRYDLDGQDVDPLDDLPSDALGQVKRCREFYKSDSLFGGLIDVLADLTSTPLYLKGGSEEARQLFNAWMLEADIAGLDEMMALEHWRSGIVYTTRVMAPLLPTFRSPLNEYFRRRKQGLKNQPGASFFSRLRSRFAGSKEAYADWIEDSLEGMAAPKKRWTAAQIPVSYAVLDPASVTLNGPISGETVPSILVDKETKDHIQGVDRALRGYNVPDGEREEARREMDELIRLYGEAFIEDVLENRKYARLDPQNFRYYHYKRQSYERYAYPPGGRALPYLQLKRRLRDLALNIISNAIGFVVLVRIGSDALPANKQQLDNVASSWKERPRKKNAAWWFTLHTTQVEIIAPGEDAYGLLREDIFTQPNSQIAQAFGVNLALFTGVGRTGSQGYSLGTIALRPTIQRIRKAQRKAEFLIYSEMLQIADTIGMPVEETPKPEHQSTGLENPSELASAFIQAFDRGTVSIRTFLERGLNVPFYEEMNQREWERDENIEDIFPMRGAPTQLSGSDYGRPPGELDAPSTNPDGIIRGPQEENRLGAEEGDEWL